MSFLIKKFRSISFILLFFCGFFSCQKVVREQKEALSLELKKPYLKVKIFETEDEVLISPEGSFSIKCVSKNKDDVFFYSSASIMVKASEEGLILCQNKGRVIKRNLDKIFFIPEKKNFWLYLNKRGYRGVLEVNLNQKDNLIFVLNLVYIEDYLKGVVPAEMGNQGLFELEALKAQAIASRTYALFKTERNSEKEYHLESTIIDQLYSGMEIEDLVVNIAVERTKGEVITKDGDIIKAYYHACCGGRTENVEDVWSKFEESYLKKVDDEDFCSWYKRYEWERVWKIKDLERVLLFSLKDFFDLLENKIGKLIDLQIIERTSSKRVEKLCIRTEFETYYISKDDIRWVLRDASDSTQILPSTLFELELKKNKKGKIDTVIAKGKGNGHGVGMCQTGAIGMARRGFSYIEILKHYYTGVQIKKIYQ